MGKNDLQSAEDLAYKAVVAALVKLDQALEDLRSARAGEMAKRLIPAALGQEVKNSLEYIRSCDPGALGLPLPASSSEQGKREAALLVDRLQERVSYLRNLAKTNKTSELGRRIEQAEDDLSRAKQALAIMR